MGKVERGLEKRKRGDLGKEKERLKRGKREIGKRKKKG